MVSWPEHPEDEYVEVTGFGESERSYLMVQSFWEQAAARARESFIAGRIQVEEFERRIERALRG